MPIADSHIDEAVRQRFESDWRSGHPRAIENYVNDRETANGLATLEELVHIDLEFRWRQWTSSASVEATEETVVGSHDETVVPIRPPAIEPYLLKFPALAHAEVLSRLIESEVHLRRNAGQPVDLEEYGRRFPQLKMRPEWFGRQSTETLPCAWGEYVLVSRLGQGAMGVVYRAQQPAAGREVALKRILTDKLQGATTDAAEEILKRFETESKAAASLTHENIVPVYDVGQVDGQPFFAMQLVEGCSLSDLVRENTLAPQQAATYIAQVAEGVHYAHGQGVFHRDLKPANILVDERTDKPLVTDFGLARWEQTDQTITQSGQIVGSPAYMPPEQARDSHRIDRRSDVYSLGATLYHLLTGRPPFPSANLVETLRRVLHEQPLGPRKLNPSIPRDLDTIVVQCLRKEPRFRYQSAADLAADLRRFVKGEPVLARPISTPEKVVRWCRRNKTVAALSALCLLGVVSTMTAMGVGYSITQEKNTQLAEKNTQLAEGNVLRTELIDDWFTDVSEDVLLGQASMQPLRSQLLEKARNYHESSLDLRGNDPEARADVAVSELRLGQIAALLGKPTDGLAQYDKAITLMAALPAQTRETKRLRRAEGDAWNAIGQAKSRERDYNAAAAAFAKAETIRQKLVNDFPANVQDARKLFNIRMNRGIVALAQGDVAQAKRLEQQAQDDRADRMANDDDPLLVRDFAIGQYNLMKIAFESFDDAAAGRLLRDVVTRFETLTRSNPVDVDLRFRLAVCRRLLGQLLFATSSEDENVLTRAREDAAVEYKTLLAEVRDIVRHNPNVPAYRRQAAELFAETGRTFCHLGRPSDAHVARTLLDEQLARLPTGEPGVDHLTAISHYIDGFIDVSRRDNEAALVKWQQALDQWQQLVNDHPNHPRYQTERDQLVQEITALEDEIAAKAR